ncbi:hypothetical protein UCRNP2_4936 [Neofusicoccum parvum UCRNP2]|uniref:Uncharacterized protein n=1 Tax=Botryosphaeria parva (strain UCR-NP2) TaxID=1287680 RepID=R1GQQ6_BOTPV|nr:hypothetical protein UCRNP2_4936 [Neofusicoccum parvum UCRNP2]
MRNFFLTLREGPVQTPEIDRSATFDGRPCLMNEWTVYGLKDDDKLPSRLSQPEDSCRKRKADDALSDAETEDDPVVVRMRKSNGEEGEVIDSDNTSEATWTHSDFESLPFKVFLQENLFISVHRSVFSTDGPNRRLFDDEKYNWFIEAVLWLRTVWYRLDNAPDVYFKELGVLSRAIRDWDHTRIS